MVEITGIKSKEYLFTMKKGYDRIDFSFGSMEEGAEFMFQAMEHAEDEITFEISTKEGEANETV